MMLYLRIATAFVLTSIMACGALAAAPFGSVVDSSDADQAGALAGAVPSSPPVVQAGLFVLDGDDVRVADQANSSGYDESALYVGSPAPVWDVSIGTVILHRQRPAPGTIVASNPGLAPFQGGSDFNFGWSGGLDLGVARRTASGNIWEFRYFNNQQSATDQFVTPGSFIGAGFTGPGGTNFVGNYSTKLNSFELNWKHSVTDRFMFLTGFRAIELNDDLDYHLNTMVAEGDYHYRNQLYGAQFGGDWALTPRGNPLQFDITGKAGIYGNTASGGISEYQGNHNFIGSFLGTGGSAAFVGEIRLNAAYIISRHWAIRGGYQLLWLDNLALASDAASRSLTNPALLRTVNSQGDLFYQGVTMAIDFIW